MSIIRTCRSAPATRPRPRRRTVWRIALLVTLLAAPSAASAACDNTPPHATAGTPASEQPDDDLSPGQLAVILAQSAIALRDMVLAMADVWERAPDMKADFDLMPVVQDWEFSRLPVMLAGAAPAGCADQRGTTRRSHVASVFSWARTSWRNEEVRDVRLEPLLPLEDEIRLHPSQADAAPP